MIETLQLAPGVTLRCFRDTRFKQGAISFQLVRKMEASEASMNALIPAVLLRGTKNCPDLRAITEHLDELYGASVNPMVRRIGDYQTTGLYCAFMDDRFALPGDQVLRPMIEFLKELLLDSPLEGGGFPPAFVESEKKNLIATIESELNDKRAYAMSQLLKTMCRGDSFALSRMGEPDQVAAIDPVSLYRHYQDVLRTSPLEIFYVGSTEPAELAELLKPLLAGIRRAPQVLVPQTGLHPAAPENITETMDVAQGKLCMGFTTSITNRSAEFAAMQVMNTLFGAGMTSKLFVNVREKLSLCYSVGSGYYSTKGLVVVSAGIDFGKEELTRAEILRQLAACQAGEISENELHSAKAALLSSLRAVQDSPSAIEGFYATAYLSGLGMGVDEYMAKVEAVELHQVVAAAKTVQLHTTYFLKGGSQ